MVKILNILLVILLCSCSPGKQNNIGQDVLDRLEDENAITLWKKTVNETDECSSTYGMRWFAETYLHKNWQDCCIQHDFDYREGHKYGISKEQADYELWQCVESAGHPVVARFVYSGVSAFGGLFYKN